MSTAQLRCIVKSLPVYSQLSAHLSGEREGGDGGEEIKKADAGKSGLQVEEAAAGGRGGGGGALFAIRNTRVQTKGEVNLQWKEMVEGPKLISVPVPGVLSPDLV